MLSEIIFILFGVYSELYMAFFQEVETFFTKTIPSTVDTVYRDVSRTIDQIVRTPQTIAQTASETIQSIVQTTGQTIQQTVPVVAQSARDVFGSVFSPWTMLAIAGIVIFLGPRLLRLT